MNPISAGAMLVGKKGAGLGVKRLSSGFWNATGNRPERRQEAATGRDPGPSGLEASSTRPAGGAAMDWWIEDTKSISM